MIIGNPLNWKGDQKRFSFTLWPSGVWSDFDIFTNTCPRIIPRCWYALLLPLMLSRWFVNPLFHAWFPSRHELYMGIFWLNTEMRYSQAAHFTASPFHFHRSIWAWIPLTGKLNMWKLTRRRVGDIFHHFDFGISIFDENPLTEANWAIFTKFPCKPCSLRFVQPGVGVTEWQVVGPQSSKQECGSCFYWHIGILKLFHDFRAGESIEEINMTPQSV